MTKTNRKAAAHYIDKRLINRLRIYTIVMIVMLVLLIYEVLKGTFSLAWAIGGILIGLGIGTIVSRMYRISWDDESSNVIGHIDWIGGVILILYLIFIFTRTHYLSNWLQGAPLIALIFSITAGTMLGRVITTEHGIKKILETWKKSLSILEK